MWKAKYSGSPFYLRRETPGWLRAGLFVVPRCQPRRQPPRRAVVSPTRPLSVQRDANSSPPPLCPNKEEFGVCVGRQTFTHRKLSPVENAGEMWWFNAGGSGKRGGFSRRSKAKRLRGGGRPWVLGREKTPGRDSSPRQNGAWHREAPLPSAGEKVKANQVNSAPELKAMLGVILNFFTRTLRNALPPPPPLGLFLNRDHLWLIVHIV